MAKYGAKEVLDVIFYDSTGTPKMFFDSLKTSNISFTTEKVYARGGKGNPKILTWETNKEGKITLEDALISPRSLELVSGVATAVGAQVIYVRQSTVWQDVSGKMVDKGDLFPLTCSEAGVISLAWTPKEAASAIKVYLASDDYGTPVTMTGASLSGKDLTLGAGGITAAGGKSVIVYYTRDSSSSAKTWVITADKFAGSYKMVGHTLIRNASTKLDEPFQVVCDNLQFASNLELGFSAEGEPTPTSFECEILRASDSQNMMKMTAYEY